MRVGWLSIGHSVQKLTYVYYRKNRRACQTEAGSRPGNDAPIVGGFSRDTERIFGYNGEARETR